MVLPESEKNQAAVSVKKKGYKEDYAEVDVQPYQNSLLESFYTEAMDNANTRRTNEVYNKTVSNS